MSTTKKSKAQSTTTINVRKGFFSDTVQNVRKGAQAVREAVAKTNGDIVAEAEKLLGKEGATVATVASALNLAARKGLLAHCANHGHNVGDADKGSVSLPTSWTGTDGDIPEAVADQVSAWKSIKSCLSIWKRAKGQGFDTSDVANGVLGAWTEMDRETRPSNDKPNHDKPKGRKAPKDGSEALKRYQDAAAEMAMCLPLLTVSEARKVVARALSGVLTRTGKAVFFTTK